MTSRPTFRQADVTRAIRAALKAGLKAGEFDVHAVGDEVTILTHPAGAGLASNDDGDWVSLAGQTEIPRAKGA